MDRLSQILNTKELETVAVLKKATQAEARLGELNGLIYATIDKTSLMRASFMHMFTLQEAKGSSEIENIVTTNDELFRNQVSDGRANKATQEVTDHAKALAYGFQGVSKNKILRQQDILAIQAIFIKNNAGIRKVPGTVLKNSAGETVYTPPSPEQVPELLGELVDFINDDQSDDLNALVKMAIIHYQFEGIHPFGDGNGRTGRIINLLYLVLAGKIDLPPLYMSHYIVTHKAEYYRLLRAVKNQDAWEDWILYMIDSVDKGSEATIQLLKGINKLMFDCKRKMREQNPRMYDYRFINSLFKNPYITIKSMERELGCSYLTARNKLDALTKGGYVEKTKKGRNNYYINKPLLKLIENVTVR